MLVKVFHVKHERKYRLKNLEFIYSEQLKQFSEGLMYAIGYELPYRRRACLSL